MKFYIWYRKEGDNPINVDIIYMEIGWRGNVKRLAIMKQEYENGEINIKVKEIKSISYDNSVGCFFRNIKCQIKIMLKKIKIINSNKGGIVDYQNKETNEPIIMKSDCTIENSLPFIAVIISVCSFFISIYLNFFR